MYYQKYQKYKRKYFDIKMQQENNNDGMVGGAKIKQKTPGYYTLDIGEFQQISNKMIVSDPSYKYDPAEHKRGSRLMKLNLVLNKVLPGTWYVALRISNNEKRVNAFLVCTHKSVAKNKSLIFQKAGVIGVDSGQAGIYDLEYYQDESIVPKKFKKNNISDPWYEMNCKTSLTPTYRAGGLPYGAVSMAGFGDGLYTVYVAKKDNNIVCVSIDFNII